MKRKIFLALIPAALLCAFALRSARNAHSVTRSFFAMDTPVTVTAYGPSAEAALDRAEKAIAALEARLSVTRPDSAVSRLNAGEEVSDPAALAALKRALELHALTSGAFDPTLYPALRAWGFTTDRFRVPDAGELAQLRAASNASGINLTRESARLAPGTMVDFGALGKGLAGDLAAQALREGGVKSAVINLGGNVQTLGRKPGGGAWRIGIRDPEGGILGVVETGEGAVITSGSYERYFERDGVLYWHILDPVTAAPARSGAVSVTVLGANGATCDALATAYFVMGPQRAAELWRSGAGESFIMLTDDGELFICEDVQPRFSPDSARAFKKVTVIRR